MIMTRSLERQQITNMQVGSRSAMVETEVAIMTKQTFKIYCWK